jgi:hypothetical protein
MGERVELEQVLADAREEAAVLESNRAAFSVDRVRQLLAAVSESAEEWLTWLSEGDAMIRSGYSADWLRSRFEQWRRDGHARMNGRSRQYRACAIPRRANTVNAAARGRAAAERLQTRKSA